MNSSKRNKSTASRSSAYTQSTGNSSVTRSSQRSKSTSTTVTTMTSMEDDGSFFAKSPQRKLLKRSHSPGPSIADTSQLDRGHSRSLSRSKSRASSRASSREPDSDYSDLEDNSRYGARAMPGQTPSDRHLALQLDLARRNSNRQEERNIPTSAAEAPLEDTIYEGEYLAKSNTKT